MDQPQKKKGGRPTKDEIAQRPDDIELGPAKIEEAIEHIMALKSFETLWRNLGFKSRASFNRYCKSHPEFAQTIEDAKLASCPFIEDRILHIKDEGDPKEARLQLDALLKLLSFYDPKKYGPKLDVNMQATISIRSNLDAANKRVAEVLKDVTPIPLPLPKVSE